MIRTFTSLADSMNNCVVVDKVLFSNAVGNSFCIAIFRWPGKGPIILSMIAMSSMVLPVKTGSSGLDETSSAIMHPMAKWSTVRVQFHSDSKVYSVRPSVIGRLDEPIIISGARNPADPVIPPHLLGSSSTLPKSIKRISVDFRMVWID